MKNFQVNTVICHFSMLILLIACTGDKKSSTAEVITFNINVADVKPLAYHTAFDSIGFVKLETSEEAMLGWVEKIDYTEERMYIKGNGQEEILIFDRTGKYISKIAKKGKGPGEYREITSFAVDHVSGNVLVSAPDKLITYDQDGNFIGERAEEMVDFDFIINDKKHIFSSNRYMNFKKPYEGYNIVIKDDKGNLLDKGVRIEPYFENFVTGDNVFSQFNSTVAYFQPYADTIYHINEAGIKPVYAFDFGEQSIPYAEVFEGFMKQNPMKRLKTMNEMDPDYAQKHSFTENAGFIHFKYIFNKALYGGIINKKTGEQLLFDKINHNGFVIDNTTVIGFDGDYLVSVIDAHKILEQFQNLGQKSLDDDLIPLKEIVARTNINDNPIMVFYHLKK